MFNGRLTKISKLASTTRDVASYSPFKRKARLSLIRTVGIVDLATDLAHT